MSEWNDAALVQIVDAALADSAQRSGAWLACRPGCNACCHGVFAISSLDAERLNRGFQELQQTSPDQARQVAHRVIASRLSLREDFPGDPETGILGEDLESEERFQEFANDAPCPILDPVSGTCDLYAHRPLTCRVFGPPVRSDDGFGVCELCFQDAPEEEVSRCELQLPDPEIEESLTEVLGSWQTIVAFALKL